ncbi:NADH-quinone oxidoreductase subunit J family protein [Hufsiella ginkgonis]|uniref:NADH-quinone oxidoreductase subunit J n=1 Tax=Hufsiella ginkgonis TaxID=2695274 RepID=A0A7K1Y3D5_9SPHI|nr:NADH-quinone oxidoreductase subunit J [Hufsiella ginkgonis]MXV17780.1 NADH-quinone oxidoreductase subunit J [Hufsiella ginkgonis]
MNPGELICYILAGVVVISALVVVLTANLVRSVFLFFVTLFALAGLYVFSLADFVAVTQVIVYVGGVLVLMLFAFMLSNKELLNSLRQPAAAKLSMLTNIPAGIVAAGVFTVLAISTKGLQLAAPSGMSLFPAGMLNAGDNTIHLLGVRLMTNYLLPFELASVFLLMALIGAAHLARKGKEST